MLKNLVMNTSFDLIEYGDSFSDILGDTYIKIKKIKTNQKSRIGQGVNIKTWEIKLFSDFDLVSYNKYSKG